MDNKKLYAFLKSAEIGSQAAAADALGYTPSAVSQLVSSLEKELGLTLLERSSKGVSVTEEGQGLIPLINDYLAHEQRIYDYAADINGLLTGTLAITAYPSAATNWLPEIVGKFSADHIPDGVIKVSIAGGPSAGINVKDHRMVTLKQKPEKFRSIMEFGSMKLARDLFDGKVNAVAQIGEGNITMKGMINMLDNMNRILDRVALYLA
jgi:DNA-binding MarR family transcriptional regulator